MEVLEVSKHGKLIEIKVTNQIRKPFEDYAKWYNKLNEQEVTTEQIICSYLSTFAESADYKEMKETMALLKQEEKEKKAKLAAEKEARKAEREAKKEQNKAEKIKKLQEQIDKLQGN